MLFVKVVRPSVLRVVSRAAAFGADRTRENAALVLVITTMVFRSLLRAKRTTPSPPPPSPNHHPRNDCSTVCFALLPCGVLVEIVSKTGRGGGGGGGSLIHRQFIAFGIRVGAVFFSVVPVLPRLQKRNAFSPRT